MSIFKEIIEPLEKDLEKFNLDIKIDVLFSNFDKNYDVQINNLVQIKKIKKFNSVFRTTEEVLKNLKFIENFVITEAGFINLKLSESYLKTLLSNQLNIFYKVNKKNEGTVLFDFGGANIGKSLHVGHIRTLNIGRSLKNIYDFAGYKTLTDIHYGDWGMPVSLIIAYIEENEIEIKTIKSEDLEYIYPKAAELSKTNEDFYLKTKIISKKLNEQDDYYLKKWLYIYEVSTKSIRKILNKLNFNFDIYKGESDVATIIPTFIENLKSKNLIKIDQNAFIATNNQDPPSIIVKSDGSYVYLTTDLATVIDREKKYKVDEYIYVVDQRQKNHFEQLFDLVKYFSLSVKKFTHVGFGTINNLDGKPLKTRDGGNYKLEELYADINKSLLERNSDIKNTEILSRSVLTFSDLVTSRLSDYKFDIEKFTNINGKSAVYIQYTQVRAKKLLHDFSGNSSLKKIKDAERPLIIQIIKFNYYFDLALKNNEPHHLAEYLYGLCQEFNVFYKNNKIFTDKNSDSEISHLIYVVESFYNTLIRVFECLGIEPVESM